MNGVPFLPSALWMLAAGSLILLLLVIFGYHVYQRGRMRALVLDAGDVATLAARKGTLAAEVAELKDWLAEQRAERMKLEGERHQQELARAELTRLEQRIAEKKQEDQAVMTRMADLDMAVARRRQFHSRLEAEIRSLEAQREELEPMEKYAHELKLELEQGKARLAQLAQEEIRTQSLQTQAQLLKKEIAELTAEIAPMREEREKLKNFVDQARHASAVRNEQLLEQKREMQACEQRNAELKQKLAELESSFARMLDRHDEAAAILEKVEKTLEERQRAGEDLRQAVFAEQTQLDVLMQRREEKEAEVTALAARKTILELEAAKLKRQVEEQAPELDALTRRKAELEREIAELAEKRTPLVLTAEPAERKRRQQRKLPRGKGARKGPLPVLGRPRIVPEMPEGTNLHARSEVKGWQAGTTPAEAYASAQAETFIKKTGIALDTANGLKELELVAEPDSQVEITSLLPQAKSLAVNSYNHAEIALPWWQDAERSVEADVRAAGAKAGIQESSLAEETDANLESAVPLPKNESKVVDPDIKPVSALAGAQAIVDDAASSAVNNGNAYGQ